MLEARVGDDVDDVRAVAKIVELIEGEEAHAGEIRFLAEDAIEFDRMADGFVNLQAELAAAEDDVPVVSGQCAAEWSATASSAMRGALLDELDLLDEFVALQARVGRRSCLGYERF